MKKSDLLNFVGRYHLAGATTSVKWDAKEGALQTEFITDDQNVIGHINASNLDLGENELGVYATPQLVKMLTATGEDLTVDVNDVRAKGKASLWCFAGGAKGKDVLNNRQVLIRSMNCNSIIDDDDSGGDNNSDLIEGLLTCNYSKLAELHINFYKSISINFISLLHK